VSASRPHDLSATERSRGRKVASRRGALSDCAWITRDVGLQTSHPSVASGQEWKRDAAQADRAEATYRGGLVTPPLPKPRFVLTDTSGAPFDFWQRTRGSVTLLFFGYTYCPEQCPLHMATLGAALKKIPAGISDQVKLVFVTTDPARDVPAVLRRWLDHFDSRFIGLTGTEAAIEAVQRSVGVPPAKKTGPARGNYAVAHANFVLAYTRDNLAHLIYPGGVSKDDWVHDLPLLISETWSRP
jgi:protein SCO1/2